MLEKNDPMVKNVSDQLCCYTEQTMNTVLNLQKKYELNTEVAIRIVEAALLSQKNDIEWKKLKLEKNR